MSTLFSKCLLCFAILLGSSTLSAEGLTTDFGCPDSNVLGPALIDGLCWSCLFPVRLMGMKMGEGDTPSGATTSATCNCKKNVDDPVGFGLTAGMWNPARLIEVVRNPWCSPVMGGKKLMDTYELMGPDLIPAGSTEGSIQFFRNVHYLAFPLLQVMELLSNTQCNPDGYTELDIIAMSEVDPTHNDPELEFFTNPFGAAFAEVTNLAVGAAACAAETANIDTDYLFWWSGCIGAVYPTAGTLDHQHSHAQDTTLIATRYLTKLHMVGLARKTMGDDSICNATIFPTLLKSQYKFSRVYPQPEAAAPCCHRIGASPLTWGGEWRNIPGISEYVYLQWRWTDCCLN